MFEPVKLGFSGFMYRYWEQIAPTTPQIKRYLEMPFKAAVEYAPTRMIDKVEEAFAKYLRIDMEHTTTPHKLPVIFVAFARDYSPTGRDYGRQVADAQYVIIPGDPKQRTFKLKTVSGDIRVQVAFCAREEPTCKSLAAQFLLYLDEVTSRRFNCPYKFAGLTTQWPAQVEAPDSPAMNIDTEAKNLNILTVDVTLKVTTPIFIAPKTEEESDGQGAIGTDDPPGFKLVQQAKQVKMEQNAAVSDKIVS